MPNTICHVEIPSTDLECCKRFYEAVFGWKVDVLPEGNYALFCPAGGGTAEETGGVVGGGFDPNTPVGEGGCIVYIKVDDIPATLASIGEHGGSTIKEKTQISPEHGFYALFKDCCGNKLGLWSRE